MNWLQRLIQQATTRLWPTTEHTIRQKYTIYFDVWPESFHPTRPPRGRWSKESLVAEHSSPTEALLAYVRNTHKPPARSSLTMEEAFIMAQAVFENTRYDVYVASGYTEWVKPLIGTDSVMVFERVDEETLQEQPLVEGDVVLFNWHDTAVMHYLTAVDSKNHQFYTYTGKKVPFAAVHNRLAAVFYTQPPDNLHFVLPPEAQHQHVVVDVWQDNLFRPAVPRNKLTPHSAIAFGQETRLDWQLLRRFMWERNGDVWLNIANTNSMEPFLDAGTALPFERLSLENLATQPLYTGDIVNWGSGEYGRLHRIIGYGGAQKYYIKGDNNPTVDHLTTFPHIALNLIRHRVVGVIYTRQQQLGD